MEFIQDILAAIGVVLNGIPQGLLALSYGFASVPTALGFAIGAVSCGLLSSVAPISFQAETIVMAGSMGKTRRDRLSMVMFGGLIMVVLGLTGALSAVTAFAGDAIVHAMMAGVGFVLVRTAFNMVKENQLVGWVSVASAVVIYLITKALDPGNALVYHDCGLAHHFQRGGQTGRAETWGEHCGGKDVPSEAGKAGGEPFGYPRRSFAGLPYHWRQYRLRQYHQRNGRW